MPGDFKPWIDLLTWQLLALIGGLAVLPAIYIFVLRIGSATIGGTEFKLTARDVSKIEEEADELTEESTAQEAAAELVSPPSDEPADDLRERLTSAITTWKNLQIITKARAHLVGGPEDMRAVVRNLELLAARFTDVLSREDVNRAEGLKADLNLFKENPAVLTKQALRSFRIKAGKLAKKIEQIRVGLAAAVEATQLTVSQPASS